MKPSTKAHRSAGPRPSGPSRRGWLGSALAGLLGSAALLAKPKAALAFRDVDPGDIRFMLEQSCTDSRQLHQRIIASIEAELGMSLSDEDGRAIAEQLSCPHCGCRLMALMDAKDPSIGLR